MLPAIEPRSGEHLLTGIDMRAVGNEGAEPVAGRTCVPRRAAPEPVIRAEWTEPRRIH